MFVVEIGFFITLVLTVFPTIFGDEANLRVYNGIVTVILFVTILFANLRNLSQKDGERERHRQKH